MDICPKCGGVKIVGPRYENTGMAERLRFVCLRCGYSKTTPTLDASQEKNNVHELFPKDPA